MKKKDKRKNESDDILTHYLQLWNLQLDGDFFDTHSSILAPVIYRGRKAMLKIPAEAEERAGCQLMIWWEGIGAAQVWQYDDDAIVMERIISSETSLIRKVQEGDDDEATRIICQVAQLLHRKREKDLPKLVDLDHWFKELWAATDKYGAILRESAKLARKLLDNQHDQVVLHGDLHHENLLHSQERGWLAIDPKGIYGERAFDYANIVCNPNKETALKEGRLIRQVNIISQLSGIDKKHLLEWIVAWGGLSAAWILNDADDASLNLGVAQIAWKELLRL